MKSLQWRHNGRDSVSKHQPHGCLLNRLFRCRSKKTSKLRVTGVCGGIHRGPVNSPHKWPATRKMLPFHDVIVFFHIEDTDLFILHSQYQVCWFSSISRLMIFITRALAAIVLTYLSKNITVSKPKGFMQITKRNERRKFSTHHWWDAEQLLSRQ